MTTSGLIQGINERANTGLGEQSREVEVQRNVVLLKDSLRVFKVNQPTRVSKLL